MPKIKATQIAEGVYAPLLEIAVELPGQSPGGYAFGIGGPVEKRLCTVSLRYLNKVFATSVEVSAPVVAPSKSPPPLLGREDVFANFRVQFEWNKTPPTFGVML